MITRKKLIIIIAILAVFCVFSAILLFNENESDNNFYAETLPEEFFFEPDYGADIMSEQEYISLNRIISYKNGAVTYTGLPENYESTDKILAFIANFVDTIINGDAKKHSDFFSEKYEKECDLPERFTMQRLHNIKVEKISEGTVTEDGVLRNQYIYSLEYMIFKNDGTYRRDIDINSTKAQYLVITEREGALQIDGIITYVEK